MKRLILILLLLFPILLIGQIKNYTIEAVTRLQTNGTFIYQGSTIDFTGGILSTANGGTGIDGTGFTFYHTSNANIGTVPWNAQSYSIGGTTVIDASRNLINVSDISITGDILVGNFTTTSTANTRELSLGGTYSNTPGDNLKLKILDNGAGLEYGIGVSSLSMDFDVHQSGARYNFYSNGNKIISFSSVGDVDSNSYRVGGTTVIDALRNFNGGSGAFNDVITITNPDFATLNLNLSDATGPTITDIRSTINSTQSWRMGKLSSLSDDISFQRGVSTKLTLLSTGIDVIGNETLSGYVGNSGTFVSGFAGSGWKLDPDDNGDSHLILDRLTVRDRMDVYELVINQIRATNGSLWVSDAVKVETVSGTTLSVNDDTNITFLVNDVIKAQQFDGKNVRTYTATVTSVAATSFTVSNVVGTGWDGMELVRIGNTTDTNRQGAVYLTSSDNNAPYIDIIDGNTDTSFSGDTKGRFGRLDGITSATFGPLSGYGFWTENGYLEGGVSATFGEIANWSISTNQISSGNIEINSTGYIRHSADAWRFNADGSGILSNGAISWTSSGILGVNRITAVSGTIGAWSIGATTITAGNLVLDSGGSIKHASNLWSLNNDGSGILASGNISWTAGGVLDVDRITASDGTIGAFSIDATYIWTGTKQTTNAYTTSGMTIGNGAIRAQKFRVDTDGKLYATDGTFSGSIIGSTITGGILQTATTGQRVVITTTDNTLRFYDASNTQRILIDDNLLSSRPAIKITEGAFYVTGGSSLSYMDEALVLTPEVQTDVVTTISMNATNTSTANLTVSGIKQIDGTFTSNTDGNQFVDLSAFFPNGCIGGVVGSNANTGTYAFKVRGSSGSGNIGLWVDRDNTYSGSFTVRYVAWGY